MVLQMPRFGLQKMFKRVFINPTLDLSPVLQDVLHSCEVCGEPALIQCPLCACDTFGPLKVSVYLCSKCDVSIHKKKERKEHVENVISLNEVEECTDQSRNQLELFAVVSIATSHYVSFVKCGEKKDSEWVFFDSMADRHGKCKLVYVFTICKITHQKSIETVRTLEVFPNARAFWEFSNRFQFC